MDLDQEFWVCDGNHLLEFTRLTEVVTVSFPDLGVGIVLEAADHIENRVLCKHHLKEGVLVEQENVLKDLKEVMEALKVLQILTNVKQI